MKGSIGVFDSGIGGLTVVKEIIKILPNEDIIYLGDTARVPYGPRGAGVIKKFSLEIAEFLLSQKVKFLVVACNTISATCLSEIQSISPVPVLGVIDSAVSHAVETTITQHIGVIGTRATIGSGIYKDKITKSNPKIKVSSISCPLFVPLAEEGLHNCEAAKLVCQEYLKDFLGSGIDTLILGCTHYPLLKNVIQETIGKNVVLVDSAKPTAKKLKEILEEKNLLNNKNSKGRLEIHVTDAPLRVQTLAKEFLGNSLAKGSQKVVLVNL